MDKVQQKESVETAAVHPNELLEGGEEVSETADLQRPVHKWE